MTGGALLCLGFGYTAAALARRLGREGWSFRATARSAEAAARIEAAGGKTIGWTEAGLDPSAFEGVDAVLVSTPPAPGGGCPAFRAASSLFPPHARRIAWTGYLSSNAVYGDHGGAWVDEESMLRPASPRAFARIAAEADWAAFAVEWSAPFAIFRLPGIYGPGRSAFDALREGRAQRVVKPGQVFNRMHVDDIAAALAASIAAPLAGDLFNFADDEPAPPQDVIAHAADLIGVARPPEIPFERAELSEMAKSFYADNKRVSNQRMKSALGVTPAYPTYREGLAAILEAEKRG